MDVITLTSTQTLHRNPTPDAEPPQMDTLVMSSGSFAFTAAYSFVGDTAVYMPSGEEGECRFRDFQHECVKEACPGQVNPDPKP